MLADEEELSANVNPDHEEGSTPPEGELSTNVVDDTSASNLSRYLIVFLLSSSTSQLPFIWKSIELITDLV